MRPSPTLLLPAHAKTAGSCRRALEGVPHRRIELGPRRPRFPLVEVVHLGEHRRRRRGDGRGPRDPELGWLHGNHDDEQHDEQRETDENLDEHV